MDAQDGGADYRSTTFALIVVSVLFLIPIGLLVGLFIEQSRKDITFVEKEISGVNYALTVWPVIDDILNVRSEGHDLAARKWEAIRVQGELNDPTMDTVDARKALGQALSHGEGGKDARDEIMQATVALIIKIDDGSNLTLDPDLASYYLMDSLTVKLPELALRSTSLLEFAAGAPEAAQPAAKSLDSQVKTALILERFRASLAAFDNSVDAAARASGTGVLQPDISAARFKIDTAGALAAKRIREWPSAASPQDEQREATKAYADLARAQSQYWDSASRELERVLAERRGQLISALWLKLLSVGAVCCVAFAVAGSLALSANRGVDKLVKALRRH